MPVARRWPKTAVGERFAQLMREEDLRAGFSRNDNGHLQQRWTNLDLLVFPMRDGTWSFRVWGLPGMCGPWCGTGFTDEAEALEGLVAYCLDGGLGKPHDGAPIG